MKNWGSGSVNGAWLPFRPSARPLRRRQYPGALKGCGVKIEREWNEPCSALISGWFLAPEIQLVCEENVTTAQNNHSLYSSIDGSNSRSIMRFSLCWPQHEWKPGAPPGSDVSASGRVHVMGQTDNSILNIFPYLLHIPIDWNWHTRKTIISLKR